MRLTVPSQSGQGSVLDDAVKVPPYFQYLIGANAVWLEV